MPKIMPFIVMLTANLGAFLYCVSEFVMVGTLADAPGANVDELTVKAWLWGGGTLLFFCLTIYLGWRLIMYIKAD